jgi:hypothetical protein
VTAQDAPAIESPFVVEQHASNDDHGDGIHEIRVALTPAAWRTLVGDIARAIYRTTEPGGRGIVHLIYAAGRTRDDMDRHDALTALLQRLEVHMPNDAGRSWMLTPDQAGGLLAELDEALVEPETCPTCGRFVEQPSQLSALTGCASCHGRQMGERS